MKAVVFKGPKVVALEDRPIPKIQEPTDVICRVRYTALCGRYAFCVRFFVRMLRLNMTHTVSCMSSVVTSQAEQALSWAMSSLQL